MTAALRNRVDRAREAAQEAAAEHEAPWRPWRWVECEPSGVCTDTKTGEQMTEAELSARWPANRFIIVHHPPETGEP